MCKYLVDAVQRLASRPKSKLKPRRRRTQAPLISVLKCWFLSLVPVRVPKSGAQRADSGVGM
jgi:hypothetical protein